MTTSANNMGFERYSNGIIKNNPANTERMDQLLSQTGHGFCLAKFRQVTMHLGTGMMHGCHHPTPHKIPLDEIKDNPAALFNTKHIKQARREMLNNKRPRECDYCWRVEDEGGKSDRIFKSMEGWAFDYHDEITQLTGDEDVFPSYLEVSFSNVCNMKCIYCGPEFSSKWVEELKQYGKIDLLTDTKQKTDMHGNHDLENVSYKNRDFNPYIDAFWKWFPEMVPHLRHYRITGGEPLMSKETFRSMDWLIANPNQELEFSVNSNLSVPDKLWDTFVDKLTAMRDADCVKKITVYTSVEGWGERAEYARTGLNFALFKQRVEQLAEMDNIRVIIMAAFNILSITSFQPLVEWIYELKKKHNPNNNVANLQEKTGFIIDNTDYVDRRDRNKSHMMTVGIDIPYLRQPSMLDVHYSTHDLLEKYLIPTLSFMGSNVVNELWNHPGGFEVYELEKFKRIVMHRAYYNQKTNPDRENHNDITTGRAKFYDYINELDRRRGTNFLAVFPEMADFYADCKRCRDVLVSRSQ